MMFSSPGRLLWTVPLALLLAGCNTIDLNKEATKAGAGRLKDESAILGTFENQSTEIAGERYQRLWELLEGGEGPWRTDDGTGNESSYGDAVRIARPKPGTLEFTLLSSGKPRRTAKSSYSVQGKFVHLRHDSSFGLLPLGYVASSGDLALTATPGGDLVVLSRFSFSGIYMLIGSAGDRGTLRVRFPRQSDGRSGIRLRDRTSADSGPQQELEIGPDEWTSLARDFDRAAVFIAAFVPAKSRSGNLLADLDKACAAWLRSGKRDRFSLDDVTRMVGGALGNQAISEFGGKLVRVGTWRNSKLAISPNYVIPFESIRENLKAGRTDFIVPMYRELKQSMKR